MAFLSQINLAKLFQADYIFELSPAATGLYLYFLIIFSVLIISAIASIFIIRHKKKIYNQGAENPVGSAAGMKAHLNTNFSAGIPRRLGREVVYRQLQKRFLIFGLTIGAIGLLLTFFRFEQIPYLGSRLMFLSLMITFFSWGAWIGFYIIFTLPKEKKELSKKQKFIKYLPRHKGGLPQRAAKGNTKW